MHAPSDQHSFSACEVATALSIPVELKLVANQKLRSDLCLGSCLRRSDCSVDNVDNAIGAHAPIKTKYYRHAGYMSSGDLDCAQ